MGQDQDQIELLVQLQTVDLQIDKNADQEKSLSSRLKEIGEEVKTREGDFANRKQELKNTRKERMEKELQIEELEGKLQKHEEEKYRVKSQDEFEAVEREIAELEKKKDKQEDLFLKLMEKEEQLSDLLPSLQQQLEEHNKTLTQQRKDLNKELTDLQEKRKSLIKKREKLPPQVNKVYYSQYQQLRKSRDGLAVVKIENGVCGGCSMKVPPSLIGQMRKSRVVYCESCSRIIYLGERGGN